MTTTSSFGGTFFCLVRMMVGGENRQRAQTEELRAQSSSKKHKRGREGNKATFKRRKPQEHQPLSRKTLRHLNV